MEEGGEEGRKELGRSFRCRRKEGRKGGRGKKGDKEGLERRTASAIGERKQGWEGGREGGEKVRKELERTVSSPRCPHVPTLMCF